MIELFIRKKRLLNFDIRIDRAVVGGVQRFLVLYGDKAFAYGILQENMVNGILRRACRMKERTAVIDLLFFIKFRIDVV